MNPRISRPPQIVSVTGRLSAADRARIQAAIRRGVTAALARHHADRQRGGRQRGGGTAARPSGVTTPPDAGFPGAAARTGPRITTAQGDVLHPAGRLAPAPILWPGSVGAGDLRAAGGAVVETGNLRRARDWGEHLFGAGGYAILEVRDRPGRFVVAALTEPLDPERLDLPRQIHDPDAPPGTATFGYGAQVFPARDYNVVAVGLSGHRGLLFQARTSRGPHPWSKTRFLREMAAIPAGAGVARGTAARAARDWLTAGSATDADIVHRLALMDWTAFKAMSWPERADHLIRLTRFQQSAGEDTEAINSAIVALVVATTSVSELEAMFALLRRQGLYERLFTRLDKPVFRLLVRLGEFEPLRPVNPHFLREVISEFHDLPDGFAAVEDLGTSVWDWLVGTVAGLRRLGELPAGLANAAPLLARLLFTISRAVTAPPDPEAIATLEAIAVRVGTTVRKALAGLSYAERLGTRYDAPATGAHLTGKLYRALRVVVVLEILAAFVGVTEVRAAAAGLGGRLGELLALLRGLRSLALAERVAKGGEEAHRAQVILAGLADAANLTGELEAARLLRILPEHYGAEIARLADRAPTAATLEALRRVPGDAATVTRLRRGLELAALMEHRAGGAGEMTEEMAHALGRLLETTWPHSSLSALLKGVARAEMATFAGVIARLSPAHLTALGPGRKLSDLARSAAALRMLTEAGGDVMFQVYRHGGFRIERFERVASSLDRARTAIGDPVEYRQLLDRLAAGEVAPALDALLRRDVAAGLHRLRPGEHGRVLRQLSRLAEKGDLLRRDALAAVLADMSDRELSGLEQLLRLAEENRRLPWATPLDLPRGHRASLLTLLDDVAGALPPSSVRGLDKVLISILHSEATKALRLDTAIQGSWGQLGGARTLLREFGATRLEFEVTRLRRVAGSVLRRDVDIAAEIPGRGSVSVEVKTNVLGRATFDDEQIFKDLLMHAETNYQTLIYLYHPDSAGELGSIGRRFLQLFDTPRVQLPIRELAEKSNLDIKGIRDALDAWTKPHTGGLRTYKIDM